MSGAGTAGAARVRAWLPGEAYSLFAAEKVAVADPTRWGSLARNFLRAELSVVQSFTDPGGVLPAEARIEVDVWPARGDGARTRVQLLTVPLAQARDALGVAERAVAAVGGAGFDALLARAQRLWQVRAAVGAGGDARAPLVLAAVLAVALPAPVVPPEGGAIFGVKTARERLDAAGWGT